jgi:lipopolysaccharide export system permease protein
VKRLDALIVRELLGPWFFGVALFSSLLLAATYLGRIAEYAVRGVPPAQLGELALLLLPAILVQTFPMSMLLSSLLGFGRLSGDSEIVALRAAGASLHRILAPVAVFALVVAGTAFLANEHLVPRAAKRSEAIMSSLARNLSGKSTDPVSMTQYENGKLTAIIHARNVSPMARTLEGVTVIAYEPNGRESFILFAKEMEYRSENDWRIRGGATLISRDLRSKVELTGDAWPEQMPKLTLRPEDILSRNLKSFESLSMAEIREQIEQGTANRTLSEKQIRNLEYGYWNKIALPLAAVIFGLLGGALGVRNHRTPAAAGFALAVAIIFAYMTVANFMNVWALNGALPPYVASFSPLALGAVAAAIIIKRKNA